MTRAEPSKAPMRIETLLELSVGSPIGQLRAAPVRLGQGAPRAILAVYAADFDVDPWVEMFYFPSDTLKLALFTEAGCKRITTETQRMRRQE